MTDKTGGPAFPRPGDFHPQFGMTLRDYFAAKAMSVYLASPNLISVSDEELAFACYDMADAMLKARES